MPHLQIQYSANCEDILNMSAFCQRMADEILELEFYPLGGLRVRAARQNHVVIADGHPKNAFIDMIFRIGKGRNDNQKKQTGERLFSAAQEFLGGALSSGHFMLSLEIIEIESEYSWKANSVHERLKG